MEYKITDYDGLTKKLTERPANADEIAFFELKKLEMQAIEIEKQTKIEAKAAAQAKLEALGLTVEDLQALGL